MGSFAIIFRTSNFLHYWQLRSDPGIRIAAEAGFLFESAPI